MDTTDSTANPSLADTPDVATNTDVTAATTNSPAATTTADTQAPASPGDKTASSPDAPVDDKAGLLQAVLKVVEAGPKNSKGEGTPAAPDATSPKPDPTTTAQAAADPLEADPTEDELKGLVPRTKARIEKLLTQRNAARTDAETLKPNAAKWQQMDGYLKQHDLAAEDVNLLLGVGAALRRGDFKAFRDGVMPYVELCNQALGISLAPDIQAKVDAGELTAEAAKELSTTRFANGRLQGQAKVNTEAAQAATVAEAQARTVQVVQSAVVSWENEVKGRDPDYAKKAPAVQRIAQALISTEGHPTTAEAAVALAKRAYDEANGLFAAARPAPVATRPTPSGARAVNGGRPEPKTLMEAAMMGLERSRA